MKQLAPDITRLLYATALSAIPARIFLVELMEDWLTTFLITRSSRMLEIHGWPDLLLSLNVPSL